MLAGIERQLIAEVVEPDLVGSAVSDLALVGRAPFDARHLLLHNAHRQAEPAVDAAHPRRIAPREIVVGGQHMDAVSRSRKPGNGRHRRNRLAFAGLHLDDLAVGKRERSLDLDVE